MLNNVLPINNIQNSQSVSSSTTGNASNVGQSFSNFLGQALDNVNKSEQTANAMVQGLANGNGQNMHDVMLAMEKSSILLQTTVEVRNKVIDAYQEIMRMQV